MELSYGFHHINCFIELHAPNLKELRLSVRDIDMSLYNAHLSEGNPLSSAKPGLAKIKATKKVQFAVTSFSTDDEPLDILIEMLDNHDMIEELTIAWYPYEYDDMEYGSVYLQGNYTFPHLEALILVREEMHHIASHIHRPLLERVELVDRENDQE